MESVKQAAEAAAAGVQKMVIGEKKQKVKKDKSGDRGADSGMFNCHKTTQWLLIHSYTHLEYAYFQDRPNCELLQVHWS